MVGIVLVSHSHRIAEGAAELAREMGGPDVRLETAGGLDTPDHAIGTDAVLVMSAIERAWSDDGVLVLMDLGSAVLSAEMALDLLPEDRRSGVLLCEAPFVEGAVAAAVTAKMEAPLEDVAREARGGLAGKVAHLGSEVDDGAPRPDAEAPPGAIALAITVRNPHGLHARPAARFVQTASAFDARVEVRNLTNGHGPANAASLNSVAILGASEGHQLEVTASGAQADEAIAALRALAGRNFDEPASSEPPATVPSADGVAASDHSGPDGVLRGHPASPGIAIGAIAHFHVPPIEVPEGQADDPESEFATLDAAIEATALAIGSQRTEIVARAGVQEAEIFDAHMLFLRDDAVLAPARTAILDDHATAAHAWRAAIDHTAAAWDAIDDPYLRARAADLRSVGDQVLARIVGVEVPTPRLTTQGILIAADLTPSDTAGLDPAQTLGVATARGGPTSHAAVLTRSLGIPAIVGMGEAILRLNEGTQVVLNADDGSLTVDPDAATIRRMEAERVRRRSALREARALAGEPAITTDGTQIEVSANVGRPEEVAAAVQAGADGVGLFRTEFLFMNRGSMPDEDEQAHAYRSAAEALAGRPLLLRTLDAGADKPIPYLEQRAEPNPFLGVRGLRLSLARPDLLRTQLRAVLRVAEDHSVRVMFPMVATTDELDRALALLEGARDDLRSDAALETGVMVEVPSAALIASSLAAKVDFLSIGTNDLTQYTLAADRGNEHVAGLSDALHPAVLRLVRAAVDGAEAHGRWVGICGELAGDPVSTPLLLGLGVRELSMSAPAIATVKQAVRAADLASARTLAANALELATASEVRDLLERA
jgi:multiphosphoryl transfer protein